MEQPLGSNGGGVRSTEAALSAINSAMEESDAGYDCSYGGSEYSEGSEISDADFDVAAEVDSTHRKVS